jgi:hypothetical protein
MLTMMIACRGAAILNKPEGSKFIEDLWRETVEDLTKIDPALGTYIAAQ